ncbi:membrane protein [Bacteroidia bacterium]|nr:membrane protein [Bacteroidia bacterium]
MKKLLFVAFLGLAPTLGVVAQTTYKFGHINGQEVLFLMSERDSAQAKMMAYAKDLEEQVETMQVEYNNKLNSYQKQAKTWSDAIREQKEKELQEIGQRIQEFQATAQRELQEKQTEFLQPVIEKANAAIRKVGKDGGFTYIFDTSSGTVPYADPEQSTDIMPQVRKELNITKELPKR